MANEAFQSHFEATQQTLATQILATQPGEHTKREQLYFTHEGMQMFLGSLHQLIITKDNLLMMQKDETAS